MLLSTTKRNYEKTTRKQGFLFHKVKQQYVFSQQFDVVRKTLGKFHYNTT